MQHLVRRAVILGQFLALLIAATASFSTVLARNGASFPTLQSALNYFLLALIYGTIHFWRGGARSLSRPAWQYALLAALDVEANFVIVTAFRYTSLTSVTLLDCWSIPVALALTRLLGLAAYRQGHYAGAALCVLGLALLVATDNRMGWSGGDSGSGSDGDGESASTGSAFLLGDALVVLGATIYAACNVLQEHLLGDVAASELLCMLGFFGFLWSLLQGLPVELPAMLAATWTPSIVGPWIGFGVAMFIFYSLVPYELSWGGAAMLNLSLLSSDLWTALARLLFFGGFTLWSGVSFLLSFALLAAGIAIYSVSGDAKHGDTGKDELLFGSGLHRPAYLPISLGSAETEGLPSVYTSMGHRGEGLGREEGFKPSREYRSTTGRGGNQRETELSASPPAQGQGSRLGAGLVPKESSSLDNSHTFQP